MMFGLSSLACLIWWFVAGMLSGWMLYWLLDRFYARGIADPDLEADTLRGQLRQSELSLHNLRNDHDKLALVSTAATERSATLTSELQASNAATDDIRDQLAGLRADLDARLKRDLAAVSAKDAEIAKLKSELASARESADKEASSAQARLHAAVAGIEAARNAAQLQTAELARLRADADAAAKTAEANTVESSQLKSDIDHAKKAAAMRSDEVIKLKADLSAARAALDPGITGVKSGRAAGKDTGGTAGTDVHAPQPSTRAGSEKSKKPSSSRAVKQHGEHAASKANTGSAVVAQDSTFGFVAQTNGRDDLTIIEGIGPKIAELLTSAEIDTFAKLAAAETPALKSILEKGGSNFALANPATWSQQAGLCLNEKWEDLKRLQDALVAGRVPPSPS